MGKTMRTAGLAALIMAATAGCNGSGKPREVAVEPSSLMTDCIIDGRSSPETHTVVLDCNGIDFSSDNDELYAASKIGDRVVAEYRESKITPEDEGVIKRTLLSVTYKGDLTAGTPDVTYREKGM